MVVVYNFNVIGKFADPILHRYVACLEWLQNNPPLDVEFQVNVEEYFETPSENRKRDVCQQFGGKFLQHRSGCLIYATVDEGNNGKIDKVLFFQDDSRFFPWVSKYFSFKDEAHYLSFKRAGKKAHQKEIKRTGRSYLKLETRLIDGTQRIIEVELFSEILPISADQFIERFEHGIVDQLKRIKQNQFLHFGIPGKQPIKCVPPESYQFRHSQPGLLGFCQNSSGELDLNNWYITLAPLPQLDDKKYVIFGRIITGMRACWQLSKLQTSWIGKPLDDHQIGGFGNVKIIPKVQKKGGGEEGKTDLEMEQAAVKVQCAFRGKVGRKVVQDKRKEKEHQKEEVEAATKVQSLYRGKKAREEVQEKITKTKKDELAA